MSTLPVWLTGHRLDSGLALACWRSHSLRNLCRAPGAHVAHEKKAGPSNHQRHRPRGQAAPDLGKFSAIQRVPPQVGSICVVMRRITCASCTTPPAYSGEACTGATRRNAHINAAPLTSQGPRLAPPGGDAMR